MQSVLECTWTRAVVPESGGGRGDRGTRGEWRRTGAEWWALRRVDGCLRAKRRWAARSSSPGDVQSADTNWWDGVLGRATRVALRDLDGAGSAIEAGNAGESIEDILRRVGRPFLDSVEIERLDAASDASLSPFPPSFTRFANRKALNVAVLLSGGVDSSLALYLLHKVAGHNVTAFYLQIWFQEDFRNTWDACPWEEDLEYCQKVCDALGVPLKTVPLTNEYWDRVVQHSIKEVRAGRTPNPDMLCNSRVKFGAFYEYLEANHADEFDRVASGHYASLRDGVLALTPDVVKDQTYFLANLRSSQLRKAMFPLGGFDKPTVRALAGLANLPTKGRKDSQGICFLGKVKFDEFIREHLGEWPGPLIDRDTGEVVGYHSGYWFYTVGQRKGIGLPGGPWFVVEKDILWNAVYISREMLRAADDTMDETNRVFDCVEVNWHLDARRVDLSRMRCKVRHGPRLYGCDVVVPIDSSTHPPTTLRVSLDAADQGLAAGQYAVLYDDADRCVCCGVIRLVDEGIGHC